MNEGIPSHELKERRYCFGCYSYKHNKHTKEAYSPEVKGLLKSKHLGICECMTCNGCNCERCIGERKLNARV